MSVQVINEPMTWLISFVQELEVSSMWYPESIALVKGNHGPFLLHHRPFQSSSIVGLFNTTDILLLTSILLTSILLDAICLELGPKCDWFCAT
jgi:hypothetical protein